MERDGSGQFSDEELTKLRKKYQPQCKVFCDEAHAHSALEGCVSHDNEDIVTICQLLEHISHLDWCINEASKALGRRNHDS